MRGGVGATAGFQFAAPPNTVITAMTRFGGLHWVAARSGEHGAPTTTTAAGYLPAATVRGRHLK